MTTGFSHSNSDVSLSTRPTPECALTIRSAPTGMTAAIIDNSPSCSMTLAYDGWNQTATPETVQTLRTCNGTDGDDRTPKVCTSSTPPRTNQPLLLAA